MPGRAGEGIPGPSSHHPSSSHKAQQSECYSSFHHGDVERLGATLLPLTTHSSYKLLLAVRLQTGFPHGGSPAALVCGPLEIPMLGSAKSDRSPQSTLLAPLAPRRLAYMEKSHVLHKKARHPLAPYHSRLSCRAALTESSGDPPSQSSDPSLGSFSQ